MGVGTEVRTWHDGMLEFGMDSKHPSENHEFSILGEMVIKGKDSIDIKALHQSKGCAIRKTTHNVINSSASENCPWIPGQG